MVTNLFNERTHIAERFSVENSLILIRNDSNGPDKSLRKRAFPSSSPFNMVVRKKTLPGTMRLDPVELSFYAERTQAIAAS